MVTIPNSTKVKQATTSRRRGRCLIRGVSVVPLCGSLLDADVHERERGERMGKKRLVASTLAAATFSVITMTSVAWADSRSTRRQRQRRWREQMRSRPGPRRSGWTAAGTNSRGRLCERCDCRADRGVLRAQGDHSRRAERSRRSRRDARAETCLAFAGWNRDVSAIVAVKYGRSTGPQTIEGEQPSSWMRPIVVGDPGAGRVHR